MLSIDFNYQKKHNEMKNNTLQRCLLGILFTFFIVDSWALEYIVPVTDANIVRTGTWTGANYGAGIVYYSDGTAGNTFKWKIPNQAAGKYEVFIESCKRSSAHGYWDTSAAIEFMVGSFTYTKYLNQKYAVLSATAATSIAVTSGVVDPTQATIDYTWVSLGVYNLSMNSSEYVKMTSSGNTSFTMASRIKIVESTGNVSPTPEYIVSAGDASIVKSASFAGPVAYGTGSAYYSTTTAGCFLTWKIPNQTARKYEVFIENVNRANAHSGWDTSATIEFKVGSNTITKYLNQKYAVLANTKANSIAITTGVVDPTDAVIDYTWVSLGVYNFAMDNTEYVKITSTGGSYAMASRIKIVETDAPLTPYPNIDEYIIDNTDSGYAEFGTWAASGLLGYNSSSTRYSFDGTAYATWTPTGLNNGFYKVSVFTPTTTANPSASYEVHHNGKVDTVIVNQTLTYGFVFLGLFDFSGIGSEYVKVLCKQGVNTRTDAVKFEQIPATNTTEIASYFIDFGSANLNNLTQDLSLPTTGYDGTTISWSSSNPLALSNTGILGTVTQDETVTLIATISKSGETDFVKQYSVRILYSVPLQLQTDIVKNDYSAVQLQNGKIEMTTGIVPSQCFPTVKIGADWDLSGYEKLVVTYKNTGSSTVSLSTWVVCDGWGAVSAYAYDRTANSDYISINPGETKSQIVYVHAKYADNTTQIIDPSKITALHVIAQKGSIVGSKILVESVKAQTIYTDTYDKSGRLVVPTMEESTPAAGKRVRYKLSPDTNLYSALYLPTNWEQGEKYPVIVEYNGNVFYSVNCYSTGLPEDCVMGYGDSQGQDFIWISMPFVSLDGQSVEVNGWGSADLTKSYTLDVIRNVCENYGGDPSGVFIAGFSRGAIATGFIGLMDDEIADTWIGFHATQHTDGSNWNGAATGYEERGARVNGRATMIVDNDNLPWATLMPILGNPMLKLNSGILNHTPVNSLDNRASTLQERQWYLDTYQNKPGTYTITGTVKNLNGDPIPNALVETGKTHFTYTNANGEYVLEGLIKGQRSVSAKVNNQEIDNIQINSSDYTTKILNFTSLSDITTATEQAKKLPNSIKVINGVLTVDAFEQTYFSIHSADGRLIEKTIKEDKYEKLLNKGLYFLSVNSEIYKILVY